MNHLTIFDAPAESLDQMAELLAQAFFDLDVARWLVPVTMQRHRPLRTHLALGVEQAMRHGRVRAALYLPTNRVVGVAAWIRHHEPAQPPPVPHRYRERLADACHGHHDRFTAFDDLLAGVHPVDRPHHYLALLGVAQEYQGRGIGRSLLHDHHRELDDTALGAYLVASSHDSARLYQRQGYTHLEAVRLPHDGPHMYPMWRNPARPARTSRSPLAT
ncbi:GNAT family N-acetyltransferase [Saccharothrix sp.]|uniref:GNAT family N-acetyltransferase n=1 Tax=Saccharothrix sp. TaxID=1873460 RepID=UPI0028124D28|nr:GNAT family N-acetyltransferase [Saccharothrix sp.]